MELRHLRYFVAVAEELHFGRAARRLRMTQQPLSQQIRDLERELGVSLFRRTKRQVGLTEAGHAFLAEARGVLVSAGRAAEVARCAGRGEIGAFAVGFNSYAIESVLPAALRAFRARSPAVRLDLRELTTGGQLDALREGQIDAGFVVLPVAAAHVTVEPIIREPFVAVLPASHPLAREARVPLRALRDDPFILVPRAWEPGFHDQCLALCQAAGFSPLVVQETEGKQTMLGLVAAGMGVSLAPASLQAMRRAGVVYRPVTDPSRAVELALAHRPEDASPILRAFCAVVREVCATYAADGHEDEEAAAGPADDARLPA